VAFVLPTFPLDVGVHTFGATPWLDPPRFITPGQLRGPNASYAASYTTVSSFSPGIVLLVGKEVDIRDKYCAPINSVDYLEIPTGSGRWYFAQYVGSTTRDIRKSTGGLLY